MDAAAWGLFGVLGAAVVTGVVAFYGHRVSSRNGLMTGYSSLNAELRQDRAELRQEVATLKAEKAADRAEIEALKAENAALRAQLAVQGGAP